MAQFGPMATKNSADGNPLAPMVMDLMMHPITIAPVRPMGIAIGINGNSHWLSLDALLALLDAWSMAPLDRH